MMIYAKARGLSFNPLDEGQEHQDSYCQLPSLLGGTNSEAGPMSRALVNRLSQ
jgi:hypothetical protein